MTHHTRAAGITIATLVGTMIVVNAQSPARPPEDDRQNDRFRFRTGVELINVTATVTDASGRFVSGLRQDDFVVYEDDERADRSRTSAPSACRSASGSRSTRAAAWPARSTGTRRTRSIASSTTCSVPTTRCSSIASATTRCSRNVDDRARADQPRAQADHPARRHRDVRRRRRGRAAGADRAATARRRSSSSPTATTRTRQTDVSEVKQLIRETEVLVYAIGIDGEIAVDVERRAGRRGRRCRCRGPSRATRRRRVVARPRRAAEQPWPQRSRTTA